MSDYFRFLKRGRHLLLALMASALAFSAFAQEDPPGRIGRVAWLSGEVFLSNPDTGELRAAPLNQPLTSGDIITTGPQARAEIQIGAMTLRLDSGSRVEFDRIDDERVRVQLNNGRLIAKLPTEDTRRDFELETGYGRFIPRDTGIYRFENDNGNTSATSYFGTLRFESRDTALDINAGESARIWTDSAGQLNYRMAQGVRDEFTQWSAARDQRQRATGSSRHVSPEMTGAQDLDAYGEWSESSEYGAVWFPRAVAADWAPYRTGHWAWVAPWGWTWIGHEPWGFAPFHYGRWVMIRGSWAWVPGARIARPVYAPALVAWVGTPGVSLSLSIGSPPVVWFPLAPREVFVPFYRSSHNHVRYVNAPHVPHVHNIDSIVARPHEVVRQTRFVHREEPRALSTAPVDTFRHRRPEQRQNPAPMAQPSLSNHAVEAAPRRGRQETVFRHEAPSREMRGETVRQAQPSARIEPPKPHLQQAGQPLPREAPHIRLPDRPRESARPPEPHHQTRVETRQERREEQRAQPPRQENRESSRNPEERHDRRPERGNRPGEPGRS